MNKKKSTYSQHVYTAYRIAKPFYNTYSRELNVERLFLLHFDILHGTHSVYDIHLGGGTCEPLLYTFMVVSHLSKANTVRFSSKYITRGIFTEIFFYIHVNFV